MLEILLTQIGLGPGDEGVRQLGIESDRLVVVRDGGVEVVFRSISLASAKESDGVWLLRDGRVVIGDRLVEIALRFEDGCAFCKRGRRLGIEFQRVVQIGKGAIKIALCSIGAATIKIGRKLITPTLAF